MFDAYAKERGKLLDANKTTRVKLLGKYFRDVQVVAFCTSFIIFYITPISLMLKVFSSERTASAWPARTIFYCYLISTRETNTIKIRHLLFMLQKLWIKLYWQSGTWRVFNFANLECVITAKHVQMQSECLTQIKLSHHRMPAPEAVCELRRLSRSAHWWLSERWERRCLSSN